MQLSNEQTMILIGRLTAQNEYLSYLLQGLQKENFELKEQLKPEQEQDDADE